MCVVRSLLSVPVICVWLLTGLLLLLSVFLAYHIHIHCAASDDDDDEVAPFNSHSSFSNLVTDHIYVLSVGKISVCSRSPTDVESNRSQKLGITLKIFVVIIIIYLKTLC